jgi:hypothetical protein
MSNEPTLTSLMNSMIARLEYTQPEAMSDIPESRQWNMIEIYIAVDSVLASLYKQYCEAKENLAKVLLNGSTNDPMAEIIWDMHDSLRSAIETRLIELKDNTEIQGRVATLKANKNATHLNDKFIKKPAQTLNQVMAFMLWAGMILKDNPNTYDVRRDFSRAS